jgi:hypothetical protein
MELAATKAGTTNPVIIETAEPLDFYLLQETIQIIDKQAKRVHGWYVI